MKRMMRTEIAAVMFFLKRLVKMMNKVEAEKIDLFAERLAVALQEKFKGHWYPENPSKGQAYRCIRVNEFHRHDPELLRACRESGVQYSDLGLPWELTLWVDPGEVCGRYGEQNLTFSVATFSNDEENYKDTAKKVSSALERVTSDYHSGSSDEESTHSSPLTVPNRKCSDQMLNPAAPAWHPKRKPSGMGPSIPHSQHGYQPRGRTQHPWRHKPWAPPPHKARPPYWDSNHQ
ncbi:protein BTG3-like isoform X2 [Gouania willdenowi]|uniref:Anti-proliferative protein domain-containing protein n=1 Tax=Gouania willdenowi TaxID=441366 RepID=A0A8C5DBK8_GOUWI|nr:protein BTG3 isoform X2 [Gouania willdenowi]